MSWESVFCFMWKENYWYFSEFNTNENHENKDLRHLGITDQLIKITHYYNCLNKIIHLWRYFFQAF